MSAPGSSRRDSVRTRWETYRQRVDLTSHRVLLERLRLRISASEPFLEPVLVRGLWGRVGSTLLMQLLGTSPEVSFDRSYPFENRCLANLLHYLAPLRGQPDKPRGWWMDDPDRLWWVDPASFEFEVVGVPLDYKNLGVDRQVLHRRTVRGAWAAYTAAASPTEGPRVRFYAEKYGGYLEDLVEAGISCHLINLVRDPRDVWASVLAFDAKRGFYGFGRRDGQGVEQYLESFLLAVRRRLDEMAVSDDGIPAITVRYEDLVSNPVNEAVRLGTWLGVTLDPDAVDRDRQSFTHHMTSGSATDSIGRWPRDVDQATVERIEAVLGGHLEALGYAAGDPTT